MGGEARKERKKDNNRYVSKPVVGVGDWSSILLGSSGRERRAYLRVVLARHQEGGGLIHQFPSTTGLELLPKALTLQHSRLACM